MNTPIFPGPAQPNSASAAAFTTYGNDSIDAAFTQNEQSIDLNERLIKNKGATFFMKVHSNSMMDAGIHHGDVVIVDRSLQPQSGAIIIAALQGELVIRRYELKEGKIVLVPACSKLAPINVNSLAGLDVWGVVTYVIRSL